MIVNVWIAVRDDAQAAIATRLAWDEDAQGEYAGPVTDRTARLFRKMFDRATVQNLFKAAAIAGRDYSLWSVYFDESANVLQKIQDELDAVASAYPNHIVIAGAWDMDGGQVGGYTPHARLIDFMPDERDADGEIIGPAQQVTDVNLLQGQQPRDFSNV